MGNTGKKFLITLGKALGDSLCVIIIIYFFNWIFFKYGYYQLFNFNYYSTVFFVYFVISFVYRYKDKANKKHDPSFEQKVNDFIEKMEKK